MDYVFRFISDSCHLESLPVVEYSAFVFTFRLHTYVIVYGKYSGDWFVAIPNWNVAATIWNPNEIAYNTEQILDALNTDYEDAAAIAEALYKHALDTGYLILKV